MTYFPSNLFSSTSVGYKGCLIVLDPPKPAAGAFICQGRVVLGGRLNLPLPPVSGPTVEQARESALQSARATIDRVEAASSLGTGSSDPVEPT